jgi:glycosyltransferase involved in cell wall biosynthesis
MRIAHVTPVFPPYFGGMGVVANEYVQRLRDRHDVQVFTLSQTGAVARGRSPSDEEGVHRLRPWVRVGLSGFLPNIARRLIGFDLVHLHAPFFGAAEPLALARALGRLPPLILSYHMDARAAGLRGGIFALHRALFQRGIFRASDRILVSSLDYARHSGLSSWTDEGRVMEMPFGVDPQRFRPGPSGRARGGPVTLLFVGALDAAHDFKGLSILLTALESNRHDPSWRLIVVGDGPRRSRYEKEALTRSLAGRVTFLGRVEPAVLPDVYREADIHLFPSTSSAEAFGLVVLEAAASGLPTIASNLPGVRTLIEEGRTGLLVPPRDARQLSRAIASLTADARRRVILGEAARRCAREKYDWGVLMDRLEDVYQEVWVSSRTRRASP